MGKYKGQGGAIRLSILLILIFIAQIGYSQANFTIIERDGLYGMSDAEGKELIRPRFKKLGWSEGLNIPMNDVIGYYDDDWGLVSLKDRTITAPKYYSLEAIHRNLILASIIGRFSNELIYGAINASGETVIDFRYHSITRVKDLLIVSERRKGRSWFGLFNEQNQELLSLQYKSIRSFNDDLFVFENEKGKKGLIHSNGVKQVEATLDSVGELSNGRSLIMNEGKVGIIDSAGNLILQPIYKSISSNVVGQKFSAIELRSAQNHELKTFEADSVKDLWADYQVVYSNGYGKILKQNDEEVVSMYDLKDVQKFRELIVLQSSNHFKVVQKNGDLLTPGLIEDVQMDEHYMYVFQDGKWSIYNSFGRKITNRTYQDVKSASNNLIPVKRKKYWGYIDHAGMRAISYKFDKASVFKGRLAAVEYLGYQMLINQFGYNIGEPAYDSVHVLTPDLALAKRKTRIDLFNKKGELIFQTFNQLSLHPAGLLEKTSDGRVGLVSMKGEIILDPIYKEITPLDEKILKVKREDEVGLMNRHGHWILRLSSEYQDIGGKSEGMISIKKNDSWGFVNDKSQLLIANRYDSVTSFQDGLAAAFLGGDWGFINNQEKLIVQPNLDCVGSFTHQKAVVSRDGKTGLIDQHGKTIIPLEYDEVVRLTSGLYKVSKDDKFGIFDGKGEQIIPVGFSEIQETESHNFIVCRRGLAGVMNQHGRYTIPLKYDAIKLLRKGEYLCIYRGNSVNN